MKKPKGAGRVFLAVLILVLGTAVGTARAEDPVMSVHPKLKQIDLNSASLDQLSTLPGIGEKKAEAILEYRTEKGGFTSVEELKEVKGIGDRLFEKIKPRIRLSAEGTDRSHDPR